MTMPKLKPVPGFCYMNALQNVQCINGYDILLYNRKQKRLQKLLKCIIDTEIMILNHWLH